MLTERIHTHTGVDRHSLAGISAFTLSQWVADLREGDHTAALRLWNYLQPQLLELGRRRMLSASSASYDEDDLAQSAFYALCEAIQDGRYEGMAGREELWKLLSTITLNKFRNRVTHQSAQRRGGGTKHVELHADLHAPVAQLSAEQQVEMQEECERLLTLLGTSEMKQVALLKIEGYTQTEIASAMNTTRRAVQRRLDHVRDVWSRELETA